MTRPIEFRVWDIKNKYFRDDILLNCSGDLFDDSRASNYLDDALPAKEWVLMQFTGLLDSKDNRIFEGDILKITKFNNIFMAKVDFHEGSFIFLYSDDTWDMPWTNLIGNIEIIGNVYENSDLIK